MNQDKRIVGPMLLAAILAAGFGAIWGAIGACFTSAVQPPDRNEMLDFAWPDATPLILSYAQSGGDVYSFRTLQGKPIEAPGRSLSIARLPDDHIRRWGWHWRWRVIPVYAGSSPRSCWWFVQEDRLARSGYFAGYDVGSRRLIGTIGRKGFSPLKPPREEHFPTSGRTMGYNVVVGSTAISSAVVVPEGYSVVRGEDPFPGGLAYVATDDGLVEVDLVNRSVRTILQASGLLSIAPAEQVQRVGDMDGSEVRIRVTGWLAVRQEDRILLLDASGKQRLEYVLPGEIRHESDLSLVLSGSTAIVHTVRYVNGVSTYTLLWIDQQGDVLRRETVKLGQEQWWSNPRSEAIVASLALPAPAIVTPGMALVEPWQHVGPGKAPDYPTAVARSLATTWPVLLVLNALGVCLAWLVYRRHRRLGQPWAGAWAVFVFLFGIPGLLGYLFHRRWPVRVACPQCARPVPRDREVCLACGEQFPEPARRGTEVLV